MVKSCVKGENCVHRVIKKWPGGYEVPLHITQEYEYKEGFSSKGKSVNHCPIQDFRIPTGWYSGSSHTK